MDELFNLMLISFVGEFVTYSNVVVVDPNPIDLAKGQIPWLKDACRLNVKEIICLWS